MRRDKCVARGVGLCGTYVARDDYATLWNMEPIIPLVRDLIQPLQRELPGREERAPDPDAHHVGVHSLVQPLQRSYDGTAFSLDDQA